MPPALRAAALLSSLTLLSGCAGSTYSQYYNILKQSVAGSFGGQAVSRDQAAAIPYASLGYRRNGGPEAILVLATDNAGEQLWTSSARVVLLLQDGRVKRTVGLPNDLGGLAPVRGPLLPPPSAALDAPSTIQLSADFPDIGSYSVALTCRMTPAGAETITILGQAMRTRRVDETCVSSKPRWRFRNTYWIDPESKLVWRSVQQIHPKGDTLQIEIFRPPG